MTNYAIAVRKSATKLASANGTAASAIAHLLEPGCSITGINRGQFSLIDLIRVILVHVGAAELTVTTWTPGIAEIDEVAALVSRCEVTAFRLLVDRSFVMRQPQYVARVREALGDDAIVQTRTHAKFALIGNDDWKITIRTSMNFNRNSRWEQFDIDDNPDIYAFYDALVTEIGEHTPHGLLVPNKEIERSFRRQRVPSDVLRMRGDERKQ